MRDRLIGLTYEQVLVSREKYGSNEIERRRTRGFFARFFCELNDPIIRVLIVAVVLTVIFSFGDVNWLEVGGIIIAVLIATVVSTVCEMGSERAFSKIEEKSRERLCRVIRAGQTVDVSESEVVVGDIVLINQGEQISADGIMLRGRASLDQSTLNGESIEVFKSPERQGSGLSSSHELYRGSLVLSGEGVMQVTAVGEGTLFGKVARDVQTETRESPLKVRLSALAGVISKIGYIVAALVGLVYLFFAIVYDNGYSAGAIVASLRDTRFLVATLSHALTLMITVVVVAVPEGLPMMISVVLSANMRSMVNDNILVKKMVGIETAGSMNILFTDKTGTLTEGKSTVFSLVTAQGEYKSKNALLDAPYLYEALLISALCQQDVFSGGAQNSTDRALVGFFGKDKAPEASVISRVPFSSERKYSSLTLSSGREIVRGAPELLLPKCSLARRGGGEAIALNKREINEKYIAYARLGQRIVAVCERIGQEYYFLALCVMKDRVRIGVREAVSEIRTAGVQVVMITGDSRETAAAIAEECGILRYSDASAVIDASELHAMTDDELKERMPRLRVIARALPEDKTRLVRISQGLGLVVGMTGDGVNDAPSLKLADIGFAMMSGSEIAKEAADIVIMDNSFLAIVKAVLYGRTVFKSIRKFITFQLTMNLTACGVTLIGAMLGMDNPITVVQMLWINIIMDTLGGLAFAGEPALKHYMTEKPKAREEPLLSRDMLAQIFSNGAYSLLLCVAFLTLSPFRSIFRQHQSDAYYLCGFFALFVFLGIFNCLLARSERMWLFKDIGKNRAFVVIMLGVAALQVLMIYFGGEVLRCAPLTAKELLTVTLLSSSVILFDTVRRIFKKLS